MRQQTSKPSKKRGRLPLFSETSLLAFAMIFGAIGSYSVWRTLAAPEDSGYLATQHNLSSQESAWFNSIWGASVALIAAGPILVLFLWWLWRRSSFNFIMKFCFSAAPFLLLTAVN